MRILVAIATVLGFGPDAAWADCADAELTNLEPADSAVSFCRVLDPGGPKPKVRDCLRLDLDTGRYTAIATPANIIVPRSELTAPISAELTPSGVKVCKPDGTGCTVVAIPDAGRFDLAIANPARTLVAARRPGSDKIPTGADTFEVATGKHLASIDSEELGAILELLGDTLYSLQPCAGPCGGVLWNARTGKRIAPISAVYAAANTADTVNVGGDVWAFLEVGRDHGDDGVVLVDVKTGKNLKRIAGPKLAYAIKPPQYTATDVPPFRLVPARKGAVALVARSLRKATLGDAALIDRKGAVRRFTAPDCAK